MKLVHGIVALLTLALGSSAANAAGTINLAGNACSAAPGSAGTNLRFNGYGWTSASSTGNHAVCGVSLPLTGGVTDVTVTAYNRSNQTSGPQGSVFVCALNALDQFGNLVFGGSYQTTPIPYSANAQFMNLRGGQPIPSSAVYLTIDCFIPGPSNGNPNMSHLSGIRIDTN